MILVETSKVKEPEEEELGTIDDTCLLNHINFSGRDQEKT